MLKLLKYCCTIFGLISGIHMVFIYVFSFKCSYEKLDLAIVLGAATNDEILSPIYMERMNHAIHLYHENCVKRVIVTGGYGEGQDISDS